MERERERERERARVWRWQQGGRSSVLLLPPPPPNHQLSSLKPVGRMYTTGLNPFYASNFSLWSAYCAAAAAGGGGGGFAVDTMKKPSFCIADILQAGGDAENIPGSSALMVHMGHHQHQQQQQQQQLHRAQQAHSPLRPSPVGPDPSTVYGPRLSPTSPYNHHNHHHHQHHQHLSRSHGLQLTSVPRTALGSQQAPLPPSSKDLKFGIDRILSADFEPKGREMKSSLRGERFVVVVVSSSVTDATGAVILLFCEPQHPNKRPR